MLLCRSWGNSYIFNIFRLIDTQTPVEQVIEVPEISLPSRCCRTVLSAPQMAEQLVEVPTVVSFSSLQQLSVEQIITFPFLILVGVLWHRTLTLQSFMVVVVSVEVVSKVFAQDRVLQRFLSRPFLQLRVVTCLVVFKVSLQDRVQQRFLLQNAFLSGLWSKTSIFPVEVLMVFKVFSQDRVQLRFPSRCLFLQFTLQLHLSVEFMASAPAVHAAPAPVGEFMASAPSIHAAPGSSGDDASRVEQDIDVEGVDYLGRVVYHSGTCVMLDMVDFKWRSLGEGTYRLLRHSEGAKFFHFWRRRQLLVEDFVSGLVLRGGSKGLSWRWRNPEFEDGPSDYRHAVRFQSPVQARRFYDEWNSSTHVVDKGGMYKAQDARHHGLYGSKVQLCRCLVGLLVNLHLTLCFFLSSGPRCAVRVGVRIPLYGQGLCLSSWF